jgi:hypothetical protein
MQAPLAMSLLEPILLIVFIAFLIIFAYFGVTLTHHWNYYSFNIQAKRIMKGLYFFVGTFILVILLFFIGLYIFGYGI